MGGIEEGGGRKQTLAFCVVCERVAGFFGGEEEEEEEE